MRHMHKADLTTELIDDTPEAMEAAKARGLTLTPQARLMSKAGHASHLVATAEALKQALAEGWKDEGVPKKDAK